MVSKTLEKPNKTLEKPKFFSKKNVSKKKIKLKLGILLSGHGSNMISLVKHVSTKNNPDLEVACVISDNPNAQGLFESEKLGILSKYIDPGKFKTKLEGEAEDNYIKFLKKHGVNLVCLAGFMRVVKYKFLEAFPNQVINIHPSLLPDYKGLNTHKRVIAKKEKKTGCTVHLVNKGIDTGEILQQAKVNVLPTDDIKSLSNKVIKEEHRIYSEVIDKIFSGEINLDNP